MSKVVIETNGSFIGNAMRDHLLTEVRDVEAEIGKANGALSELQERRKFLADLVEKCRSNGIELRPAKESAEVSEGREAPSKEAPPAKR